MSKHLAQHRTLSTQILEYDAEIHHLERTIAAGFDDTAGPNAGLWEDFRLAAVWDERAELLNVM